MRTVIPSSFYHRLAFKLGLYMIVGTSMIFAAAFAYHLFYSRKIVQQGTKENARNLTVATVNRINSVLSAAERAPMLLAQILEARDVPEEWLLLLIREAVDADPSLFGCCVAFEPHAFKESEEFFAPYYIRRNNRLILKWVTYDYFYHDWYLIAREMNRSVWSEPYFGQSGGVIMSTYSVPFHTRDKEGHEIVNGVAVSDVALNDLTDIVAEVNVLDTGYAFLISQNGVFVTHPHKDLIMRETIFDLAEETNDPELREVGRKMIRGESGIALLNNPALGGEVWLSYYPIASMDWSVAIIFPIDELFAALNTLGVRVVAIGIAGFLALFLLALIMGRYLTQPIRQLTRMADNIASGKVQTAVKELPAFEAHMQRLRTFEYRQLAEAFVCMTRNLDALLAQVSESSSKVSITASQIASSARALRETGAGQAAGASEINATCRQINTTSRDLATSMSDLNRQASEAYRVADEGKENLQDIREAMQNMMDASGSIAEKLQTISEKTGNIGQVITTITKVANETNLLSLNASLEAEKAGEHGRGFAVVARQIRHLADQAAVAVLDIEDMITEMQVAVGHGVGAVRQYTERTQSSTEKIVSLSADLSTIIVQTQQLGPSFDDANKRMQSQAEAAEQINEAMTRMAAEVIHTRDALDDFHKATEQLNAAALSLRNEMSRFSLGT